MATKKTPAEKFRERLDGLSDAIPEDLRLPSLEENCLEGYAYLFRLVLPLLNAKGKRVFTDPILDELFQVLDDRFGGCMVASSSSAPPLWGLWHPPHDGEIIPPTSLGERGQVESGSCLRLFKLVLERRIGFEERLDLADDLRSFGKKVVDHAVTPCKGSHNKTLWYVGATG